jgi:hypothetical protein
LTKYSLLSLGTSGEIYRLSYQPEGHQYLQYTISGKKPSF